MSHNRIVHLKYSRRIPNMFVSKIIDLLQLCPFGTKVIGLDEDPSTDSKIFVLSNNSFIETNYGSIVPEVYANGISKTDGTFHWEVDFDPVMEVKVNTTTSSPSNNTKNSKVSDSWLKLPSAYDILYTIPEPNNTTAGKPYCNHTWRDYQGIMHNYRYCENCGVKESDV